MDIMTCVKTGAECRRDYEIGVGSQNYTKKKKKKIPQFEPAREREKKTHSLTHSLTTSRACASAAWSCLTWTASMKKTIQMPFKKSFKARSTIPAAQTIVRTAVRRRRKITTKKTTFVFHFFFPLYVGMWGLRSFCFWNSKR